MGLLNERQLEDAENVLEKYEEKKNG